MLKAIIFDFDGVILDTESARYISWKEAFSWYGLELPVEEWLQYLGIPGTIFDAHAILEKKAGKKIDRDELDSKRKPIFWERNEKLEINPGIVDCLQKAEKDGIKVGIASSSRKQWVKDHLSRLKISKYFQVLKNSDDVDNIKPAPDLYLKAMNELGVKNSQAIAIEDSFTGVEAAKNAGLFCVFVPNGLNKGLQAKKADLQLNSLADLDFDQLKEILLKK